MLDRIQEVFLVVEEGDNRKNVTSLKNKLQKIK